MFKKLKYTFFLLLIISTTCFAQRRVSADVEVKTLKEGNVVTVTKSVYCSNNGRLVTCFHSPIKYVMETNNMGESTFYFPEKNEVFTDNTGVAKSTDELLSIFLFGRIDDLGLSLSGYKLKSTEIVEDGLTKKTFSTIDPQLPPLCEIVYDKNYLPIYSATLTEDGHVTLKVFYSKYELVGYTPFPFRSTQIIYNSPKDSTIVRSIYSNIEVDSDSKWFDFRVPEDAKPVSTPTK